MAVFPLQSSNVFSYTFAAQGYTHFHYLVAGNNNPVLNIGGASWTIECWLKPAGVYSNYNNIFVKRPLGVGTTSYQGFIRETSGFVAMRFGNASYDSTTRLTPNTWNHVAWVFNQGANARIFINGINAATAAVTSISNSDSQFMIGLYPGENSQYFGEISNFRITQGQALYSGESFNVSTFPMQLPNNAIGPHVGGSNVAASLTGNVVLLTCNDQVIKSNGNVQINGTSVNSDIYVNGFVHPHAVDTTELQNFSYFFPGNSNSNGQNGTVLVTNTTNSLNLNTDFTIETWFYPTTNTGVLLERGYGGVGNNNASYILIWDTPNNNINFAVANSNTAAYSLGSLTGEAGSLGSPSINAWNHIAVTRAGNTYRGFLNGALTFTPGINANTPYAALGRGLTIGGMFRNGQAYAAGIPANTISGYISNLRIIRGRSIYNAAFTPSTTQLSNITNTILLTALTPNLEDLSGAHGVRANGMSEIKFSTESPFTANAIANTDETTLSTLNNATGRRQERIYDKLDTAEFTMSVPIFPELGRRQERIYDKLDTAEFAMSGAIFLELGLRQERIYDKLDIAEYITSVPLYDALGGRQNRIYNKFDTAMYAYIPIGTGDGTGGGSANIEYEFWS
jgi:hypothetical protein